MGEPGTVRLRNGGEAPRVVLMTTTLSLDHLMGTDPIALYELVMAARDPEHVLHGHTGATLAGLGLIEGTDDRGRAEIRSYVRDVILSGTDGDEVDMHLCDPREAA